MKMTTKCAGGLLVLVVLGALLPAQTGRASESAGMAPQQAVGVSAAAGVPVEAAALVLEVFHAERSHPPALFEAVQRLYGRKLAVRRADGVSLVDNVAAVQAAILIQDTREMGTAILGGLKLLDQRPLSEQRTSGSFVSSAYALRYLGEKEVIVALDGLRRHIRQSDGSTVSSVSFLKERGVVALYDTQENVAAMTAILRNMDRPLAQVLVTCHIIEVLPEGESGGAALPEALTQQLRQLTGHASFRGVATGMVRTAVKSERRVELNMGSGPAEQATLSFQPASFDSAEGVLSLEQIQFSCTRSNGGKPGSLTLGASTSTMIRADEYAVLGASGANPTFAVLHMTLIR